MSDIGKHRQTLCCGTYSFNDKLRGLIQITRNWNFPGFVARTLWKVKFSNNCSTVPSHYFYSSIEITRVQICFAHHRLCDGFHLSCATVAIFYYFLLKIPLFITSITSSSFITIICSRTHPYVEAEFAENKC